MKCDGSFGEGYALYVLGGPDVAERQDIQSHLDSGCETCQTALKNQLQLWCEFGHAYSTEGPAPSPSLRRRILDAIAGSVVRPSRWAWFAPAWRWGAAAALVIVGGAIGWLGSYYSGRPEVRQQVAREATSAAQIHEAASLRARVDQLQSSLKVAQSRLAEWDKSNQGQTQEARMAKQTITAAQTELSRTKARLADASAKLTAAQAELKQNQVSLAGVQEARQKAEDSLRAAVQDRARAVQQRDQLAERERALTAQNRDLRQQIAGYQAVADRQSNQLAPLLHLAGMLNSPSLRFLHLRGTGGHTGVAGSAFISDRSGVVVYASGLPALPQGKTYQLWLIRRQSPGIVSGGIFKPDQAGRAFVQVDPSGLARGITTVAVTDEPDGGSPGPTGAKFLIGIS